MEEAFQLLKADLVAELEAAVINSNHSTNSGSAADQQLMWSRINTKVILLIQLCQTHCGGKSEEISSEGLWFELLDCVIEPQNRVEGQGLLPFKDLVKHVVNSSMGYVNLR